MLENVKNIIAHDKKKTFKVIMTILDELGYKTAHKVIDGKYYVPQHRERTYIVGFDRKIVPDDFEFQFPEPEKTVKPENMPKLKDILEKHVDAKYTLTDHLWAYLQKYAEKHKAKGNGFGFGIADPESHTRTLSARYYKDGSEILIAQKGKNPRRLTPRECARLMGFDDDYLIPVSDTQAYRQFGNSIIVPVVYEIAKRIVNVLNQYDGSFNKAEKKLEYVPNQREAYEAGITDQEVAVL
jgi:DNA (cytosine-5)-methyltransferase 1